MAKMVLKAAYVALNAVDRSTWTSKCELSAEVEDKDVTTFASQGWKEVLGGIFSAGLALTFKNDVAAGQLDELMWALFLAGLTTFEVRASNAPVSTSNPKYTGTVLVKSWAPISGSVGDVNEQSVTWPTSGVVARATS